MPSKEPPKKLFTLLDLCVSSLRRGHANLLCIVPILTDDPRRESENIQSWLAGDSCASEMQDELDGSRIYLIVSHPTLESDAHLVWSPQGACVGHASPILAGGFRFPVALDDGKEVWGNSTCPANCAEGLPQPSL